MDVILGVEWLETQGKCEEDWKLQEWRFTYHGKEVTLVGARSLHAPSMSLKSLEALCPPVLGKSGQGLLSNYKVSSVDKHLDPTVGEVVEGLAYVLALPSGLPPMRGQEHSIILKPGIQSITVRPYRYPYSTKEIMEKIVQDMLETWIIRHSNGPFSSSVLLVKKRDSS